jgi:hypothetical protein
MANLPTWTLSTIEATAGLSLALAFLIVGAIGRFLGRTLSPHEKGAPRFGPEQARDEAAIAVPLG